MLIGDEIPELLLPPIDRQTLAAYADASDDHALVHLDSDNARQYGFPDVIAHGLLVMAYLGRAVTDWAPPRSLKSFSARFTSSVNLGDRLTCGGIITDIEDQADGRRVVTLGLVARNQAGAEKIRGRAKVLL